MCRMSAPHTYSYAVSLNALLGVQEQSLVGENLGSSFGVAQVQTRPVDPTDWAAGASEGVRA